MLENTYIRSSSIIQSNINDILNEFTIIVSLKYRILQDIQSVPNIFFPLV